MKACFLKTRTFEILVSANLLKRGVYGLKKLSNFVGWIRFLYHNIFNLINFGDLFSKYGKYYSDKFLMAKLYFIKPIDNTLFLT